MSSQRSSKPTKPPNQTPPPSRSSSTSSSLSSHLALIELKQRILTSLSKLADRDTHQIAIEDLDKIIQSLSNDGVSMVLNCLYHAISTDPKPAVKKESIRFLAVLCAAHADSASTHLTKIIDHIVKRLKDSDSQVRDACRDTIGSLAGLYLKGGDGVVSLFVKPLFELMNETNKVAQGAAAMCLAKMVECASEPRVGTFQKMSPRVCKYLNSPNFMAKASLLQVVSGLAQVGAITPQLLEPLLQTIHEYLTSTDWATRKAAADALSSLSLNTSNITPEAAVSTFNALEACKFDKIKPVRESMSEALSRWEKIAGKGRVSSDEHKASSNDGEASETSETPDRKDPPHLGEAATDQSVKDSSSGLSPTDSNAKGKGNIYDKAVGILMKKASTLTDKELNPEFFQRLQTRGSGDFPVEVVVPRACANPSNSKTEEELETSNVERTKPSSQFGEGAFRGRHGSMERGGVGDRSDSNLRESYSDFPRNPGQPDGYMNNKGNWLAIQRQLLQLERQQTHLMHMLQDFMGGSHDNMVTLENRVRGLERIVEDMARDLSISTSRRSSSNTNKYNGFPDYSNGKLSRGNESRMHFGERFTGYDSGIRSRNSPSWRSDACDSLDLHGYSRNGSRRSGGPIKPDNDEMGPRRGGGPIRFGEGPSARSVWQASKDEATLEAIRVAGDDNSVSRNPRVAIPEMTAEALGEDGVQERDPVWTSWSNAMDALHVGDVDSAFAEVLSTGDDFLLVKLMDKSGPVVDQLSSEVTTEVLHAVSQFLMEQNLFDMCLYWVQQLADFIMENGPDVVGLPAEVKREMLLNLNEASSSIDPPEDWEGSSPDQLLVQLASAWEIDLQHFSGK